MLSHSERLMDHFLNPRNVGRIEKPDGYAKVENPINGDVTEFYVGINESKIYKVSFQTCGCVVAIASSSALTEIVMNYSLTGIIKEKINFIEKLWKSIEEKLDRVPEKNWHCPPTSIKAFLTSVEDYYNKINDKDKANVISEMLSYLKTKFDNNLKNYEYLEG